MFSDIIITNYIKKISKADIMQFSHNYNIYLNDKELEFIYYQIKNNWRELIYGDPCNIFEDLKKISPSNHSKIEKLYSIYKNKYKNYL